MAHSVSHLMNVLKKIKNFKNSSKIGIYIVPISYTYMHYMKGVEIAMLM
jgi:hypothetical protein